MWPRLKLSTDRNYNGKFFQSGIGANNLTFSWLQWTWLTDILRHELHLSLTLPPVWEGHHSKYNTKRHVPPLPSKSSKNNCFHRKYIYTENRGEKRNEWKEVAKRSTYFNDPVLLWFTIGFWRFMGVLIVIRGSMGTMWYWKTPLLVPIPR